MFFILYYIFPKKSRLLHDEIGYQVIEKAYEVV